MPHERQSWTGLDKGKHSDMMQINAQCRYNGLNRDDADWQHDNDMIYKKRIAPTLLHSHHAALDDTFETLSLDSVTNESGDTRDEIIRYDQHHA